MPKQLELQKRNLSTWFSWFVMIISPFILLLILSAIVGKNIFDSFPVWSDELDYWRSLYSWDAVGFNKGYSGMFEVIPEHGTLGVHGFNSIMLYGPFVKIFGLSLNTIIVANASWISLSALAFCLILKPKASTSWLMTALLCGYVPIILYAPTSMTEWFNYALFIFYLTFLISYAKNRKWYWLTLLLITVSFGCLYRIPLFVLFFPAIYIFSHGRKIWKTILFTLLCGVIAVACYLFSSAFTAPYIQGFLYHWLRAETLQNFIQIFLSHAKSNLISYFILSFTNYTPIETSLRVVYMLTMLLSLVLSFFTYNRKEKKVVRRFSIEYLGAFLLLFVAFTIIVTLYETNDWSDFRTLSPYLFFVYAYFIAKRVFALPTVGFVGMLVMIMLLSATSPVGFMRDEARFVRRDYSRQLAKLISLIPYVEDAEDPFVNTVRVDIDYLQMHEQLHPGIGLQYGHLSTDTITKSQWLLTDHLKCVVYGYEKVLHFKNIYLYQKQPILEENNTK